MNEVTFERPQLIGFAGVALLIFGAFAPLIHLPIVGGISYVGNGRGDGIFVILLAVASGVLLYLKRYDIVLITAALAAGLCVFTFINFESRMSDIRSQMGDLNGNPFRGLADAVVDSVGLDWGWALLLLGIIGLFAGALMGRKTVTV